MVVQYPALELQEEISVPTSPRLSVTMPSEEFERNEDIEIGNKGQKFFQVAEDVSKSLSLLHHEDVSAAMLKLAKDYKRKSGYNLGTSTAAIRNAEVTKGWEEFVNSFDVKSVVFVTTPLGVAQACAALLFMMAYLAIFLPATYGPPFINAINEKAIKPSMSKAIPLLEHGKTKIMSLADKVPQTSRREDGLS